MVVRPQRRATDTPENHAQRALDSAKDQALELAADIIACQDAEIMRLRREVVILTGRWTKA